MGELIFQRIDVSARSALSAELAPGRRKGIYFYVLDHVDRLRRKVGRHGRALRAAHA